MSNPTDALTRPQQDRVEDMLSRMTLREKLGQCVMIEPCFCLEERNSDLFGESWSDIYDPGYLDMLLHDYAIGTFFFGGASQVGDGTAGAWAHYIQYLNTAASKTRLGIPLLIGNDAVHGLNFLSGSAIYSHNLGLAASWNPDLARNYCAQVAEELAAIGFNFNFAPTVDVARDQRWGRVYETLGEDPFLASRFSEAMVMGMQGAGDVSACAKHFIGYSESGNGMDRMPANLSDRTLFENHAPPFEAAIKAGVLAIMVSGADVNGLPVPASKRLMNAVLRDRMGFEGVTLSDWEDVGRLATHHRIVPDRESAVARSFNAGLDMNMAVADIASIDTMEKLVGEGRISKERVDQAAGRILKMKAKLGLFDQKTTAVHRAGELTGNAESRSVAREVARQSMTLLKNKDALLPLGKDMKSLLVLGSAADSKRHLCAGWTLGWAGAREEDLDCLTILDAIRETAGPQTRVVHLSRPEDVAALDLAEEQFDACVVVISEEPHAEWLGDSPELLLEATEVQIVEAAAATGLPVALVSLLGRPLNVSRQVDLVSSVLWAWSPGTEGAMAVAETLFGDHNPSGRLPVTFPKVGGQVPIVYNARAYWSDETAVQYRPLFAFGTGLGYTDFSYADLQLPSLVRCGDDVTIKVGVTNTGCREGKEVVQLYFRDCSASVCRPIRYLVGYQRIALAAGESKTVELKVSASSLRIYDEELCLVDEAREVEARIGNLTGTFEIADQV